MKTIRAYTGTDEISVAALGAAQDRSTRSDLVAREPASAQNHPNSTELRCGRLRRDISRFPLLPICFPEDGKGDWEADRGPGGEG